ncbi:MAG: S41 family peptidase [Thiotrichales bacterium]|nr:S41 family peptidase [Thiotrichales bacterium]
MNKSGQLLLICFVFLTSAVLFVQAQDQAVETPDAGSDALPLDELRIFTEVFEKIKNDYVEEVNDRDLLVNAIRGMLSGLDPHSAYLEKESYKELQEGTSGEFGGLGIEVGMEDGFVKVISPIDDTPAAKAGIKAGDLIIKLDDTPVKGMSLNEAVKIMRGKPGTKIVLTVVREGESQPLVIPVIRDYIRVQSVRSRFLEPGFGYLRVSQFQSRTAEDVRKEAEKLKSDSEDGLKGVIVDLRNNPGGVLSAAVGVSDLFLDKGMIVYTKGRVKDSQLQFNAKPVDILDNIPIVVLVNAGSASASEIVAGALQDHRRAIVVGEKTFGKGSVQTILPMANNSALKLTTARYYTPSGNSIQATGIIPDIIIEKVHVQVQENTGSRVKEADLSRHLENDNGEENGEAEEPAEESAEESEPSAETEETEEQEETPLAARDYSLYEALNVLKGLSIVYELKK